MPCSVLQPSQTRELATPQTYVLHVSLFSVILIDSYTGSPIHVLMLSIQAVRGLPRLRAPGIVIALSLSLHCFLMAQPQQASASFLALTLSNSSLITPALLRTHSFVFFALHKTRVLGAKLNLSYFCQHLQMASQTLYYCIIVLSTKPAESYSALSSQRRQDVFLHSF